METLNAVFTTYRFDVEVVTPVYVGMAQEKNYLRGLDYVLTNNEVRIINTDKLFSLLDDRQRQEVTLRLADGNASRLEQSLLPIIERNPTVVLQSFSIQGQPNDGIIRRLYRTGLGQYAIPGSSLKGAIRSVLLAELKKQPGSNLRNDELNQLMGGIGNNLMRFVQVGDVALANKQIGIRRTKVFSADSDRQNVNTRGEWKHGNPGNHSPKFSDAKYPSDAFVTFYEVALPDPTADTLPTLTMRLGTNLPHQLGQYARGNQQNGQANVPNYSHLLKGKDGLWLIDTIKAHTRQYLTRELAFYQKFTNNDLNREQSVIDYLNHLLAENNELGSCLLRVGAGVGFHSITGDWQDRSQVDHAQSWIDSSGVETINGNQRENHRRLKNQIFAKTRKFAFTESNGTIDFALMGFIRLSFVDEEEQQRREGETPELRRARIAEQQAAQRRIAHEQALLRKEEEKKAKQAVSYVGLVELGTLLEAIVYQRAKPHSKVKLALGTQQDVIVPMIGLKANQVPEENTTVIVTVSQFKDELVKEVRFVRVK